MEGVIPESYFLENGDEIKAYHFLTEEARMLGVKQFQQHQLLFSSHAPLLFQAGNDLVLYYSKDSGKSSTQTPNINETKYGNGIKKAVDKL
ncbi:hypothetical protein [Paenibacillus sp. YN15]|uniref:hypothetical protein n=1 Tax=Paenibacillus sp. YN15 TaxID=1742774 RepID=UPI0011BD489C|nr:hypothetical protein [Paenibacillus sp. YN15]